MVVEGVARFLYVEDEAFTAGDRCTDCVDTLVGDERVLATEVEQRRAPDLIDQAQHVGYTRAVVADAYRRLGVGGNCPGERAAKAEAHHARGGRDAGLGGEVRECGTDVADRCRKIQLADLLHAGAKARGVVTGLPIGCEAPKDVGRPHQITGGCQTLAYGPDVGPDAEDLLNQQHGSLRRVLWRPDVKVHVTGVAAGNTVSSKGTHLPMVPQLHSPGPMSRTVMRAHG